MSVDTQIKILVVENERIVAWELSERLKSLGFIVCATAATGEDAVTFAKQYKPNLVLMDIMLDGEMDGIEAAQIIRSLLNLPVIFCSAFSEDMRDRAQAASPLGFLEKPLNEILLQHLITRLLPDGTSAKERTC